MRDVVIVGAGPVGLLLASLLAQRGLDVAVLEKRTDASAHSRAIGIHPPALAALEQIGVSAAAIAHGVRIGDGVARCDGRMLGRLSFAEAGARHPFVLALPQRETEALLRERFAELRADGVRRGIAVLGVRDRDDHVEIVLSGKGGQPTVERARFVVGADGPRSVVRESSRIRWRPLRREQSYLMADYPDVSGRATTAVLFFERGGVVESFPLPGGWRRWVALTDRAWPSASAGDLAGIIHDRTGIDVLDGLDTVAARDRADASLSAFSVRQHLAARMAANRVMLAGDAAHEISPIGGQGMNLGWLDAMSLAPALELALRDGADVRTVALHDYDERRRRAARTAARQAAFNMTMGRPVTGMRLRARNGLVRSLAVPPLRGLLARAFTMRWL
ncbi:FAD-dependent oxidoreductase [Luethyella okanaganae]|uniref:FAD-dependent oxidoreductase n=1 Tax=Luethyella okanaganae TaxID=69372 RepID=A0ABW1VIQ2_9MICO